MEFTQRLYPTHETPKEKQIACLAVNGTTYPIVIGHNKIGRDPQMCSLVINMNDVSRQHALINILNEEDFTLMDLGSANKTKLKNYAGSGNTSKGITDAMQTLIPYIPYPLKNGATIQFGTIPAVFKVLEDDNDLPATQVFDVPSTPVSFTKSSKSWHEVAVTIPESPDVSDRDESFLVPSQPQKKLLLNNNLHFIKPANEILSIQPVGSNKIDNVNWNSSTKSKTFASNSSLNVLDLPPPDNNEDDIFEMETQEFFYEQNNSIHAAETQIPRKTPPPESDDNIHEMETQAPIPQSNHPTPSVHSYNTDALQISIHNLNTEISITNKEEVKNQSEKLSDLNLSDKENDDNIFNAETQLVDRHEESSLIEKDLNENSCLKVLAKSNTGNGELTDYEDIDIFSTKQQSVPKSSDLLHCTDVDKIKSVQINNELVTENIEELATQVLEAPKDNNIETVNIEDLATQILECDATSISNNQPAFEDMLTQVLCEETMKPTEDPSNDIPQYSEEMVSPFKIPLQSTNKPKKKDMTKIVETTSNDDQYYALTQDIYNDLCSQKQLSPKSCNILDKSKDVIQNSDNETSKDVEKSSLVSKNNTGNEGCILSPISKNSSGDEAVNAFVSGLSKQEVYNMIGVQVAPIKKVPSDASDVDVTPKKSKPFLFNDSEMPSSQDIKASVSSQVQNKTETSSESETDCSEDQDTPVLFRPKKKPKLDAKKDLTKSFDVNGLPSRIMMRNRKANSKLLGSCDEGVDTQIIQENITRLKSKSEKKKEHKEMKKDMNDNTAKRDNEHISNTVFKKNSENTVNKKSRTNDTDIEKNDKKTSKVVTLNASKKKIETKDDTQQSKNKNRVKKTEVKSNFVVASNSVIPNKNEAKPEDDYRYNKRKRSRKIHENIEEKNNYEVASDSKNSILTNSKNKSHNRCSKQTKIDERMDIKQNSDYALKSENSSTASKYKSNSNSYQKKPNEKLEEKSSNDISSEPKRTVNRSTRNTRQKKQELKETPQSTDNTDRKSRRQKIETKRYSHSPDPEVEVRRSKRQRTMKEFQQTKEIKSILKNKNQSTVYNVSSENNRDCSNSFKRSLDSDIDGPSSEMSRQSDSNTNKSLYLRGVRDHCVLFTALPGEHVVRPKLERLGAKVAANVKECTVVVTQRLRRTFKLMCAIGLGKPIVGVNWVQACVDAEMIVDPWLYLMKDENFERKFSFSLLGTLKGNRNFLHGYNISVTANVSPPLQEMKDIVECSGGTWNEGGERWICVSCKKDMGTWPALKKMGATIVNAEVVLSGVLKQKLVIAGNEYK